MDSNPINERRKHPRFNIILPLEYWVSDAPKVQAGTVINASESGLLVHLIKDMPVGAKLNIAVIFPKGFELANFEVLAEVVRRDISWQENRQEYEFGLKFIHILEEEHQKLKRLLVEESET